LLDDFPIIGGLSAGSVGEEKMKAMATMDADVMERGLYIMGLGRQVKDEDREDACAAPTVLGLCWFGHPPLPGVG
jgi:hypothetical protein